MDLQGKLNFEVLISLILIILYTVVSPIFNKFNFHYIHESGVVIILGAVITLILKSLNFSSNFSNSLAFDDKIFLIFILPPIIFGEGYI